MPTPVTRNGSACQEPLVCAAVEVAAVIRCWLEEDDSRSLKEISRIPTVLETLGPAGDRLLSRVTTGKTKVIGLGTADAILVGLDEHLALTMGQVGVYRNPYLSEERYMSLMVERGCSEEFANEQERLLV